MNTLPKTFEFKSFELIAKTLSYPYNDRNVSKLLLMMPTADKMRKTSDVRSKIQKTSGLQ